MKQQMDKQHLPVSGDTRMIVGMVMGAIIGLALGPVIGVAMNNVTAGVAIGAGLGGTMSAAIGTLLSEPRRPPSWREIAPGLGVLVAAIMAFIGLVAVYTWA